MCFSCVINHTRRKDDKVSAYWLISNYISLEENSTAVHFELIDALQRSEYQTVEHTRSTCLFVLVRDSHKRTLYKLLRRTQS